MLLLKSERANTLCAVVLFFAKKPIPLASNDREANLQGDGGGRRGGTLRAPRPVT